MAKTQADELTQELTHPHFEMVKSILDEVEIQILYEIDKHQKLGFLDIRDAVISFSAKVSNGAKLNSARIALDHLQNLQILRKRNELFCFGNEIYKKWFSAFFEQKLKLSTKSFYNKLTILGRS